MGRHWRAVRRTRFLTGLLLAWLLLPGLLLLGLLLARLFAAAALWCIARGLPLTRLLAATFGLVIILAVVSPSQFVPLAFDAGSVTTGVLSGPVLLALGLGLSAVLSRRPGGIDGFGLLGVASAGPIVVLLVLGWLG